MSPVADFDLRQTVISNSTFGPNEISGSLRPFRATTTIFRTLRDATNELAQQTGRTPAASARLGVCQFLIGRYADAVQTLTNADGGALTHYYLGKARTSPLDKYADALKAYEVGRSVRATTRTASRSPGPMRCGPQRRRRRRP